MKVAPLLLALICFAVAEMHRLPKPVLCPANGTICTASSKMRHECVTWPHCKDFPCSTFGCSRKETTHLRPTVRIWPNTSIILRIKVSQACIEWHCHPHYYPPHLTKGGIAGITIFAVCLLAFLIGICCYYRPRAESGAIIERVKLMTFCFIMQAHYMYMYAGG